METSTMRDFILADGSFVPLPPNELGPKIRGGGQIDRDALRRSVLRALCPSVGRSPSQTLDYRWKGEDTLNWGEPDDWVQYRWWIHCLVEEPFQFDHCVRQYSALQDIVRASRLQEIEEMYTFRNTPEVWRFLYAHLRIIDVLLEAYPHIQEHFGSNTEVVLEVASDLEVKNWDQLFAYIVTPLPPGEALDRLDNLDSEWFLHQLDRVDDLLNFDLVCV
jgi:hypothetical protein